MAVPITGALAGSAADGLGLPEGCSLLAVNGREIKDLLDYGFFAAEQSLTLKIKLPDGDEREYRVDKEQYEDVGFEFGSFLMDEQHRCQNHCVFCFIDQLPAGLREPLYFKDDDERLSFLFGNYITLTNLSDEDVDRIIDMKVSPVNVSVHTTEPMLRCMIMGNRFAGDKLKYLFRLAKAGVELNCQIVLCRGINDGEHLAITLKTLAGLYPSVRSIAVVPVGLTAHRDGLFKLTPYDAASAAEVLDVVDEMRGYCRERFENQLIYASDEWYLLAGRPIPPLESYGELRQLENGVGMMALFESEFREALSAERASLRRFDCDIITGQAAAGFITSLAALAKRRFPRLRAEVHAVRNDFFGGCVNVSGLVTATDIKAQLSVKDINRGRLILPANMLRREGDMFLDDETPEGLSRHFGRELRFAEGGRDFLAALLGR